MTEWESKKLHYELWDELAHNPGMVKCETKIIHNLPYHILFDCFACEIAGIDFYQSPICGNCPIDWLSVSKKIACTSVTGDGLYELWANATDKYDRDECIRLAILIRDAKWHFEKEEK